jgi:hypothetical protein
MSHIEVSDIIINDTVPTGTPNIVLPAIHFVDMVLVFGIIVCLTKFIKSLKT